MMPDDERTGSELLRDEQVRVVAGEVELAGHLAVPGEVFGTVIFVHGSGSSRHSPRNRFVAEVLNRAGLATLLFDLLTDEEEPSRAHVFDIALLAGRLLEVTEWVRGIPHLNAVPLGYFGASTGAAAALRAAAADRAGIGAVVSRGGRPDLAGDALDTITVPTLLIVGGEDRSVLELNQSARARIPGAAEVAVVPAATHLFSEPGALERAAELARDYFVDQLISSEDGRRDWGQRP